MRRQPAYLLDLDEIVKRSREAWDTAPRKYAQQVDSPQFYWRHLFEYCSGGERGVAGSTYTSAFHRWRIIATVLAPWAYR